MRIPVFFLAAPLLALLTPSAEAATNLQVHVTPSPAAMCRMVTADWSGTLDEPSTVSLRLVNEKAPGIFWESPVESLPAGSASRTYSFYTQPAWPATNVQAGAVYKMLSVVNGVEFRGDTVPILELQGAAPIAQSTSETAMEDTPVSGALMATDADGDMLTYELASEPANGTVTVDATTGTFVFTPALDWSGTTSFGFRVRDCQHDVFASVEITVLPVNDAPITINGAYAGLEDTLLTGSLNASDVDADMLTYILVNGSDLGMVTIDSQTGAFSFVPHANANGGTQFTFVASDGQLYSNISTVSLSITPVNDAPSAQNGSANGSEDMVIVGTVLASDIDSTTLTFAVDTQPQHGVLALNAQTGAYTFTPAANWNSITTFSFQASDGFLVSEPATVTLTVVAVNDAPTVAALSLETNEDAAVSSTLSGIDVEDDTLAYEIVSQPQNGLIFLAGESGAFTFTPDANWNGTTSFSIRAFDGNLFSEQAGIHISVTPVNDAPEMTQFDYSTDEDKPFLGSVQATDIDGDVLRFETVMPPIEGVFSLDSENGEFSYLPDPNWWGTATFTVRAFDSASFSESAVQTIHVNAVNDAPIGYPLQISGAEGAVLAGLLQAFDIETPFLTYSAARQPTNGLLQIDESTGAFLFTPQAGWHGTDSFEFTVSDGELVSIPQTVDISILPGGGIEDLPPDPATIAPPNDPTVVTNFSDSYSFLYAGSDPIQLDADPSVFQENALAVVRGRVLQADDTPIPGVRFSILNRPEFGYTKSRVDGYFDMAVNGGGELVVEFFKPGYLPVQRKIHPEWQAFEPLADVVLTPISDVGTTVIFGGSSPQWAAGETSIDADGERAPTIFFPSDVTAQMVFPNGSTAEISTGVVRVTEFTVGKTGLAAMPADLPPETAYTYAAELSLDEAIEAGASSVVFSKPVVMYLDNFLEMPTGAAIPIGYFDRTEGNWKAELDGFILAIVGVTSSRAEIDLNGDGAPETQTILSSLGISDEERTMLASKYLIGKTLWRAAFNHFSPHDWNFTPDKTPPSGPAPEPQPGNEPKPPDNPCLVPRASTISCEGQALMESVSLIGTSLTLNYASERSAARQNQIHIPIRTRGEFRLQLRSVSVNLIVAGRVFAWPFKENELPSGVDFVWDGKDAYGRYVVGEQKVQVNVHYYSETTFRFKSICDQFPSTISCMREPSFARYPHELGVVTYVSWPGRIDISDSYTEKFTTKLGGWYSEGLELGNWSLSDHHLYDVGARRLYKGSGESESKDEIDRIITTIAGGGTQNISEGLDASRIRSPNSPGGLAVAPDGSTYFPSSNQIWKIDRLGKLRHVAGRADNQGGLGDGALATLANLRSPFGVATGPDGSVYISDTVQNRIRKVSPNGIIETIAGTGEAGHTGDGGLATLAKINLPEELFISENGSVVFSENDYYIRKLGTDGTITTIFGGLTGSEADGLPGTNAFLGSGGIFHYGSNFALAETWDRRMLVGSFNVVRELTTSGIVHTIAGRWGQQGYDGDGGLATAAKISDVNGIAVARDGTIFFSENLKIRAVNPQGIIVTIAGGDTAGSSGDGGPARKALLTDPRSIRIAPDQSLIVNDRGTRIRRISPVMPGAQAGTILVPDGKVVFKFDNRGRHLATLDAFSGSELLNFEYGSDGELTAVVDASENRTTLVYTSESVMITGPYGHVTTLHKDNHGYLHSVVLSDGRSVGMEHSELGLLTSFRDLRGFDHLFRYGPDARLIEDVSPSGALLAYELSKTETINEVTETDSLGRQTRYVVERRYNGTARSVVQPDTTVAALFLGNNGDNQTRSANGEIIAVSQTPDPRFGILAPVPTRTTTLPSGAKQQSTSTVTATQTDIKDPFSVTAQDQKTVVNGRMYRTLTTRTGNVRQIQTTSPAGRQSTANLDDIGRLTSSSTPGLAQQSVVYDARGRVSTSIQTSGLTSRSTLISYDESGRVSTITDPLSRTVSFAYNDSDQMTLQTLPDGRQVSFLYDANGNLTSVTPPGKTPHTFSFSSVDLVSGYDAPDAADGAGVTQYAYNLAKQLTSVTRPDGVVVSYLYEGDAGLPLPNPNTGRLKRITQPRGNTDFGYDTAGRLSTISAPDNGKLTYSYDGSLLLSTTWSNGVVNGSVSRTYNTRTFVENGVTKTGSDFWVASESVNGANTVNFGYDLDGLLTSAGALTISRNAQNGLITGSSLGSVADTISYNGFAEPIGYSATYNGSSLYSVSYVRDALGRIASKTETVNGVTTTFGYQYDLAGRLTGVDKNGVPSSSYTYDSNGNRLSYSGALGSFSGTYDAQDRLLSYGDFVYEYTANGELAKKTNTVTGEVWDFSYDHFGNLLSVRMPNGDLIEYLIDAYDSRIGKKRNGTLEAGYLYNDMDEIVAVLDSNGQVVSRFLYLNDVNVPELMIKDGVVYRFVHDAVGSPLAVVNATTGVAVQLIEYDAFGNILSDSNSGFQPFGFAGGLWDSDTELVRFGVRDFDVLLGRWTSKDPIIFDGLDANLYGYVFSDPVNLRDPSGLAANVCMGSTGGNKPPKPKRCISMNGAGGINQRGGMHYDECKSACTGTCIQGGGRTSGGVLKQLNQLRKSRDLDCPKNCAKSNCNGCPGAPPE